MRRHHAVLVLGLLHAGVAAAQTDRLVRVVPLPPGRAITLEVTIGHLRVEGEERSDAEIVIQRITPSAEGLARLPVEVEEGEADVRIRVLQTEAATDPAYRSDVSLRVPRDSVVRSVRLLEGHLRISGLRGTIGADVRRGTIEASNLEGVVRLETGIGDVTARAMRLSSGGVLRLRAFNGDVSLHLAEQPAHARILALALNGTIESSIPLAMRETWGPRWGQATLGRGEPVISLDVITGRILLTAPRP
ncbi:MAG: hypothetical protein ACT4QD_02675 [Acidobacteriota bacterium]